MAMNRKGQLLIFGVMMFFLAFIVAVLLSEPLKEFTDLARDADHLDCNNASLTTGTALTCVAVDLTLPFFIITIILVGIGMIYYGTRGA